MWTMLSTNITILLNNAKVCVCICGLNSIIAEQIQTDRCSHSVSWIAFRLLFIRISCKWSCSQNIKPERLRLYCTYNTLKLIISWASTVAFILYFFWFTNIIRCIPYYVVKYLLGPVQKYIPVISTSLHSFACRVQSTRAIANLESLVFTSSASSDHIGSNSVQCPHLDNFKFV